MAFTFSKEERLYHKKLIAQLFEKGNRSISRFPFRFTWIDINQGEPAGISPVQVMFIVSKRNFPKASSRNRIKRQMRELYRLRKQELIDIIGNRTIALSCSYLSKTELKHADLNLIFLQLFDQLKHEMEKNPTTSVHRVDKSI